ncbi:MAG: ATP-binding protein [Candidatus Wallbacteria bacterium]
MTLRSKRLNNKITKNKILVIHSAMDKVPAVRKEITLAMALYGFSKNAQNEMLIALDETISNAIKHGNKYEKCKKVFINYKFSKNFIEIKIKDQGQGFDWRMAEKNKSKSDFTGYEISGRGIFMLKTVMNFVKFNADGTEITFLKKRS